MKPMSINNDELSYKSPKDYHKNSLDEEIEDENGLISNSKYENEIKKMENELEERKNVNKVNNNEETPYSISDR